MSPAQTPTTAASGYIAAAGASDLYEKMSSQLVLQDTSSEDVRKFANMMITDHSTTTQQLTSAAQSAGMAVPPPELMPKQQAMIDALEKASGGAREKLYVKQQLKAHQEALALHSTYAKSGDTPALKTAAAGTVPIIEQHLTMVKNLKLEK
ncbi:DUF4142 domain-containing protein [Rhizorhabdus argentea]|uniref:DUF4142 domain-containing protein n=1 Tax=Rhizorhabdus argentea TaxID=1387174 RepID=UPI0030EBCC5D